MANFFKVSPTKKLPAQQLTVKVKRLDLNGCGVAQLNNKPVFITGALEGELIEIKLIEKKNKFARAKLTRIINSSSERVNAQCQHFLLCGGCDLQHLRFEQQIVFKQTKISELFSREGIVETLPWQAPILSTPWHYRRKARIGVQYDKKAKATIGFRQKATNQLVAIKSCSILVKPLADIFPILTQLVSNLTVKNAIGHIEVIYSSLASESPDDEKKTIVIVRQLRKQTIQDICLWQAQAKKHRWQVIFDDGSKYQSLAHINSNVTLMNNEPRLSYPLLRDIDIEFGVNDFIQINQKVNLAMVEQALDWLQVSSQDKLLDLFCGLGNFSLALAQRAEMVIGVEGVQVMVDKASLNARKNRMNNCTFYQADLNSDWSSCDWFKKLPENSYFDKVLLDPARAGAEQATRQVAKLKVPMILYVSCDPRTLARDSKILIEQGYKISKISLIDMFSQTKHAETMVLFNL